MANELRFDFLDCGKGDGTLITFPNEKRMLVDLGSRENKEVSAPDILDHLNDLNNLEVLVLTHGDEDHYNKINSFLGPKTKGFINEAWIGGREKDYPDSVIDCIKVVSKDNIKYFGDNCSSGTKEIFNDNEAKLYLLSANCGGKSNKSKNTKSVVLLFEYKGNKLILDGDTTQETEKHIVKHYELNPSFLKSNFLRIGHHGSLHSPSKEWIRAVQPQCIFLSADIRQAYKSPTCSVLEGLNESNCIGEADEHSYVCYDDQTKKWQIRKSTRGIFTTIARLESEQEQKPSESVGNEEITEISGGVKGHGVLYTLVFNQDGAKIEKKCSYGGD